MPSVPCQRCGALFPSKNKLFRHLRDGGDCSQAVGLAPLLATPPPTAPPPTVWHSELAQLLLAPMSVPLCVLRSFLACVCCARRPGTLAGASSGLAQGESGAAAWAAREAHCAAAIAARERVMRALGYAQAALGALSAAFLWRGSGGCSPSRRCG